MTAFQQLASITYLKQPVAAIVAFYVDLAKNQEKGTEQLNTFENHLAIFPLYPSFALE